LTRGAAVMGTALFAYGLLTLGAWVFAALRAQWTSPLLLAVALPCGPLATLAGWLLVRGSSRARAALVAWALSLLALNVVAVATVWPDRWPVLALAAVPVVLAIVLLLRRLGGSTGRIG